MLTVEAYAKIRRAHRDGMSIREISRRFGWSRQAVRKALASAEPEGYRRQAPYACPKLGEAFKELIDRILADDASAPAKQRHTAMQLYRRLRDEHGYLGSYDPVRRYVAKRRRGDRELFVPLAHEAGQRGECDFGHIYVDFPDGRRQVAVLLVTWSHSHYCFCVSLPSEKTEAILEGTARAFEFFGCCPRELWWDNPTTVATEILVGRERKLHPRYLALASHYNFEPLFCLPAKGQEKSHVENRVKRLQRTWATPVRAFRDRDELNAYLRRCCEGERSRTVQRQSKSIGERFAEDRANALSLPDRDFDACVFRSGLVDKYQTVRYETNWYSVRRSAAFAKVTIKAYVDRIVVAQGSEIVAEHKRSYDRDAQILDPLHYLTTLARKPATLDHSKVYRDWRLPSAFSRLRERLESAHGPRAGVRHYIRVLRLLASHSAQVVAEAIEQSLAREISDATRIAERVNKLSAAHLRKEESPADLSGLPEAVRSAQVAPSGLAHFDALLSQGGEPSHG